ncbi:Fe-S cluster assembly protein SufD [Kaistia dalseonensis]|uniref:Fe-S cluster assembly protein SufD n=1 Tax=Kaistia dalseonensis TaxID=410840 RepID=A0ABU0H208_9HYPH|nr:Fe-S cluster assembly protein SufD [Kaistia dalseonensis]MCX5493517.1 Fe-S cluster assembly protein SufD [Kaistia dalseonensis]MDQ0436077.1 Fe-S cluster assembly protein SufD [Kaistia dalseonensis]
MNAQPRILRTQAEDTLAAEFAAARTQLPGSTAIASAREAAFAAFQKVGLPHRRVEAWKYTDLRALLRSVPPLALDIAVDGVVPADPLIGFDRARIVIIDGVFRPELSDLSGIEGATITPTVELLRADDARIGARLGAIDDAVVSLNTALMVGGVAIDVPEGVTVARAIEIAHVTTAAIGVHVRNIVTVGADASLRVVESHVGSVGSAYQANVVTEATIGDRAKVVWAKLQAEGDASVHLGTLAVSIGKETQFDHLVLMTGATVSRSQTFVTFTGEFARAGLFGATMIGGRQHADIMLGVDHAVPNGQSRERFKAVMDGRADGIFQGRIVVRPDAQKVDARMMTQGLLLSEESSFSAKPELEIFADDVQCAHGATSGQIDDDMLFYLLSRGIPKAEAETLLVTAFLAEAIEGLGDEAIGAAFEAIAGQWLAARGSEAAA